MFPHLVIQVAPGFHPGLVGATWGMIKSKAKVVRSSGVFTPALLERDSGSRRHRPAGGSSGVFTPALLERRSLLDVASCRGRSSGVFTPALLEHCILRSGGGTLDAVVPGF